MRSKRSRVLDKYYVQTTEWAKEYGLINKQEMKWHDELPGRLRYLNEAQVRLFVYKFCAKFGCYPCWLHFAAKSKHPSTDLSQAWYHPWEWAVYFKQRKQVWTIDVIHELTHHAGCFDHGPEFLKSEKFFLSKSVELLEQVKSV
jgi:hypothetical protein